MELLSGVAVGILLGVGAYLVGRKARVEVPRGSMIVDPRPAWAPFDERLTALEGRVKKISLEWEDAHERLLRMARSARASVRAAAEVNGSGGADGAVSTDHSGVGTTSSGSLPLTRAAVLNEYWRRHAGHQ